jgi:N-methylhydantoinase B
MHIIDAGDSLVLELPGGGGFGRPRDRDPAALVADIADGLVSLEAARRDYGYKG